MKNLKLNAHYIVTPILLLIANICYAQTHRSSITKFNVNGEERQAIVSIPDDPKRAPNPVIFAFHGHGGTMKNMQQSRNFEKLWPEAIVVYPQGLKTPGMLTDPEGKKSGWVMQVSAEENRDLVFFDELLNKLRADYKIDGNQIYATGHSNGGGFVYLLWAERGHILKAVAPTATIAGKNALKLTPKPVFHLTGLKDPLVTAKRQIVTHKSLLKLNKCDQSDAKKADTNLTVYPGREGNDVALYIHQGGHGYPQAANQAIIDFFKKHR
jgi:polyhydroxybutyrate depolymerase